MLCCSQRGDAFPSTAAQKSKACRNVSGGHEETQAGGDNFQPTADSLLGMGVAGDSASELLEKASSGSSRVSPPPLARGITGERKPDGDLEKWSL